MKVNFNKRILLVILVLVLAGLACQNLLGSSSQPENAPVLVSGDQSQQSGQSAPVVDAATLASTDSMIDQNALVQLYANVSPGVVSITNYQGSQDTTLIPYSSGSGFVYDKEGHIITNYHVVDGATELQVAFPSGIKTRAEVIGTDTDSDIAVIKVDLPAEDLVPLPLGNSEDLQVGQFVVAIGNPFGLNGTMTIGIISSMGRTLDSINLSSTGQAFSAGDLIQTDAAINPGNSGGPLLNLNGEVIGINRAINTYNTNQNSEPVNSGVGFAVSVNIVKRVVPSLISDGFYDYPYLGISCWDDIPLVEAERLGLDKAVGAQITSVVAGGPSDQAGLKVDDVILSINGVDVMNFSDLLAYLFTHSSPGDVVELSVFRNGALTTVDLTLGARPQN